MHIPQHRAIFLDRDGILNRPMIKNGKPYPPRSLDEFEIFPEVFTALSRLRQAEFLLIVITNQPDVYRGIQQQAMVEAMHAYLVEKLPIDDLEVCYDESSTRYKPLPGMILDAAAKHHINLEASYMIGDRWRDIDAGKAAGCKTIFIDRHYEEALREKPDFICGNLEDAATIVLGPCLKI